MSSIEVALPSAVLELTAQDLAASATASLATPKQLTPQQPLAAVSQLPATEVSCKTSGISVVLLTAGTICLVGAALLRPTELGWQLALPGLALVWGASAVAMGLLIRERR